MRIAHLSDLHVLSLEGASPLRFLNKRLTGYANLRFKRSHVHKPQTLREVLREIRRDAPDHVAITGDLTNLALESEFAAVRRMIDEELGMSADKVSVIPGNHDLYTNGAMKSRRFLTYFGDFVTSDLPDLAGSLPLGRFPFVRLRGPAAIIGLTSAIPQLPLVAAGKLGRTQLEALTDILLHPEVKKRTPVFLVHHPVHNPFSKSKALIEGLHDADGLERALADVSRGLLLHGHLHRRIHRVLRTGAGQVDCVGATSASLHHEARDRMAGYNVYEIDEPGGPLKISARVFGEASKGFHDDSVPKHV